MVQVAVDYPVSLIRCAARDSNPNPLFRSMLVLWSINGCVTNTVCSLSCCNRRLVLRPQQVGLQKHPRSSVEHQRLEPGSGPACCQQVDTVPVKYVTTVSTGGCPGSRGRFYIVSRSFGMLAPVV
jgi:hypothetical protein